MPRKQRIEYPDAIYHVISRGNYRKELFVDDGVGAAFEKALWEVTKRCGWRLYAYVIMSNHYHLALQTPEPNLVAGMKWLQSTFATRFNRFHNERGHVFQGRYKSLLITEDRSLTGLIDYIHLNPVRAKLCSVEALAEYERSSFPKYFNRASQAPLNRAALLSLYGLSSTRAGMREYHEHLKLGEERDPKQRDELAKRYCRGWFLGSAEAKGELAEKILESDPDVLWEGVDLRELNQVRWERIVQAEMKCHKVAESDISNDPKGAGWKVQIAKRLRRETTAKNPWIAERLNMGHPNYVSNLVNKS